LKVGADFAQPLLQLYRVTSGMSTMDNRQSRRLQPWDDDGGLHKLRWRRGDNRAV